MKTVLFFGLLIMLLTSCKKDPAPTPPTGKAYVSKMTKKDGNQVETYEFTYNANNQITTVTNREFSIQVQYNEQKQVKHIEKTYTNNRWNIIANYTYSGNQLSREQKFEEMPPTPGFSYSYNYETGLNNLPSQIRYINSNGNNNYTATINYGANQNPVSIVSTGGQRTEYEYGDKDFLLFPDNAFIYPWLDMVLTHEYGYYLPFTKQLTKIKRTTGNGWQINLQYGYNNEGLVTKLTWKIEHNTPDPSRTIEYSFEYK